ncbi:hypothetical protein ACQ4PT_058003 [Festuca glaucescens]
MMVKAESAHERGRSATMSETAAAHVEAVESATRRKPHGGTEFCGVHRTQSGEYGAQIWDGLRRAHVWLGTFSTAEEAAGAFDAAVVKLRGLAVHPSASVTVVKAESAQEDHGDGVDAVEMRGKKALPDAQTKFANVHTLAGRSYGNKSRFFQQLEALHGPAGTAFPVAPPATAVGVPWMVGPSAVRSLPEPPPVGAMAGMATPVVGGNLSLWTSNTDDYSGDMGERAKRKRTSEGDAAAGAKMSRFLEGLTKQVMEQQEAMQHRFLEVIEKREQDRMIREEAWRRQEMARLAREQEILAQERAMAATNNAAVLSYIQKFAGQSIPMPSIAAVPVRFMPPPSSWTHATPILYAAAPPSSSSQLPVSTQRQPSPRPQNPPTRPPASPQPQKSLAPATPEPPQQQAPVVHQSSKDIMTPAATPRDASGHDGSGGGGGTASSSLWSEAEVHALIELWKNLDMRLKGMPLWEEVSAGMRGMGYNRSSQRCMEKWENMNYYFKKVKDIKKTCPSYFHQLEAFHRNKAALGSPETGGGGWAASSSFWSEAEVHALIQLQTNLDMRRKGPKAPFWEEVSAGMRRMGYSRSSKRCMQKWGNMNYYFKKAKDIKKKRPSYFHQLGVRISLT